jgi:hypothetical protein
MSPRLRSLIVAALAIVAGTVCFATDAGASGDSSPAADPPACIPAEQCCRICTTGKACGKSCISEKKNCHKGRGCACNVEEVCGQ